MQGSLRTENGEWNLRMFGSFLLQDAAQRTVNLPNRKVEALLAVLALHRKYGIDRDSICEILWPEKSAEKGRTNLRHILMLLRKALGEATLDESRSYCRLSDSFQLTTDYPPSERDQKAGFMPGHEGDWFEQIRSSDFSDVATRASLLTHLLETYRWYAKNDPRGMFVLLKTNPGVSRGIDFGDMLDLLDTAGENPEAAGWSLYWRGTAEDDLQVCAHLLRQSLREAKQTNDLELASEACLELGKVYARTGQMGRAEKICDVSTAIVGESRTRSSKVNAARLNGFVLTHWGRHKEGIELLARSEDLIQNPIERDVALGSRAFFEASVGQFECARKTLDSRSFGVSRLGHAGIDKVGAMTTAIISANDSRTKAVSRLELLSVQCQTAGATQFAVYADEFLAKLYALEGERRLADMRLASAKRGRVVSRMVVTPLEAQRVATLG